MSSTELAASAPGPENRPPLSYALAAGALALATPFVSHLLYYDYPLWRAEAFGSVTLLAFAGAILGSVLHWGGPRGQTIAGGLVLTLFIDLQFRALPTWLPWTLLVVGPVTAYFLREQLARILTWVTGAVLLSVLLVPGERAEPFELGTGIDVPPHGSLPIVIHLVLDEQIGIAGVPRDIEGGAGLADDLRDFYLSRGFRVYPEAHSSFFYTKNSLPQLVNLTANHAAELRGSGGGSFEARAAKNAYFATLQARGHRLRVYQSDYIDLCSTEEARPYHCYTYRAWTLDFLEDSAWPMRRKVALFARLYPPQSRIYKLIRLGYVALRSAVADSGVFLPEWSWELSRPASVSSIDVLDRLKSDLETARPGDVFFAHVLLPHSPFAYDAQCSLLDHGQWLERRDRGNPSGAGNTPETRKERYLRYFEQIRCVLQQLDTLFAKLEASPALRRAALVVHGDHGSRIGLWDPREKNRQRLQPRDYIDNFSTLFAVRAPGVAPGVNPGPASAQWLLADFVANGFAAPPEDPHPPRIHFTGIGKRVVSEGPMVEFGDTAERQDNATGTSVSRRE